MPHCAVVGTAVCSTAACGPGTSAVAKSIWMTARFKRRSPKAEWNNPRTARIICRQGGCRSIFIQNKCHFFPSTLIYPSHIPLRSLQAVKCCCQVTEYMEATWHQAAPQAKFATNFSFWHTFKNRQVEFFVSRFLIAWLDIVKEDWSPFPIVPQE